MTEAGLARQPQPVGLCIVGADGVPALVQVDCHRQPHLPDADDVDLHRDAHCALRLAALAILAADSISALM
jgi:hypothetical protein